MEEGGGGRIPMGLRRGAGTQGLYRYFPLGCWDVSRRGTDLIEEEEQAEKNHGSYDELHYSDLTTDYPLHLNHRNRQEAVHCEAGVYYVTTGVHYDEKP